MYTAQRPFAFRFWPSPPSTSFPPTPHQESDDTLGRFGDRLYAALVAPRGALAAREVVRPMPSNRSTGRLQVLITANKRMLPEELLEMSKLAGLRGSGDLLMNISFVDWSKVQPFKTQLELLRRTDVLVSGIGTALFYSAFLPPNSVCINTGWRDPAQIPTYGEDWVSRRRVLRRCPASHGFWDTEDVLGMSNRRSRFLYLPLEKVRRGVTPHDVEEEILHAARLIAQGLAKPSGPDTWPSRRRVDYECEENWSIFGRIMGELQRRSGPSLRGLEGREQDDGGFLCHQRPTGQTSLSDLVFERRLDAKNLLFQPGYTTLTDACQLDVALLRQIKRKYNLTEALGLPPMECECVSMKRAITQEATGGGEACPSQSQLVKVEECNMKPCPLARLDRVTFSPAKIYAGSPFQITIEGEWLDPDMDSILIVDEETECGQSQAHHGGAACNEFSSSGYRLVQDMPLPRELLVLGQVAQELGLEGTYCREEAPSIFPDFRRCDASGPPKGSISLAYQNGSWSFFRREREVGGARDAELSAPRCASDAVRPDRLISSCFGYSDAELSILPGGTGGVGRAAPLLELGGPELGPAAHLRGEYVRSVLNAAVNGEYLRRTAPGRASYAKSDGSAELFYNEAEALWTIRRGSSALATCSRPHVRDPVRLPNGDWRFSAAAPGAAPRLLAFNGSVEVPAPEALRTWRIPLSSLRFEEVFRPFDSNAMECAPAIGVPAWWRSAAPRAVSSAYVHIPFCRQQCRYCDFPIDVAGARFSERSRRYVDCIIKEIQELCPGEWVPFECSPLRTLYFGGGTPSLLPLEDFRRLFEALAQRFGFAPQCEITVEMDPGTFSGEKAAALAELGVTRASVGVQSLDDEQLQREEQLVSDLHELVAWGVDHLSVYDLQYEPGTAFGRRWPVAGETGRPGEAAAAALYETTHWELEKLGFEHYEVSNYARFTQTLLQGPEGGAAGGDSRADALCETTMLRLRTMEGLTLQAEDGETERCLQAIFGALEPWQEAKLASASFADGSLATPYQYLHNPEEGAVFQVLEVMMPREDPPISGEVFTPGVIVAIAATGLCIFIAVGVVRQKLKGKPAKVVDETVSKEGKDALGARCARCSAGFEPRGGSMGDPNVLQFYESYYQSLGYPPGTAAQVLGATQQPHQLALPMGGAMMNDRFSDASDMVAALQDAAWMQPRPMMQPLQLALPPPRTPGMAPATPQQRAWAWKVAMQLTATSYPEKWITF
eukprot:g24897.t1